MNDSVHVLIVDDEQKACTMIEKALHFQNTPCQTFIAYSGGEALDILKYNQVDVLVTDIHMPGMNGIQLMKEAQTIQSCIQTIIFTGYGELETAIEAMQAGAVSYILKPIDIAILQNSVMKAYEQCVMIRQLHKSEARFTNAFFQAAAGMAIAYCEGQFINVNNILCNMLGYSKDQLLALSFFDITHPEDIDSTKNQLNRLLERECEYYQLEKRYIHKAGHPIWVTVSVTAIPNPPKKPKFLSIQVINITNRKKAENNLSVLNKQYAQQILELEKIKKQLEKTKQLASDMSNDAKEANKNKRIFLANMSHDIRTPLNAVIGMTYLLMKTKLSSLQREYVDMIRISGNSLLYIINDILDFSKIEAGQLILEHQGFDLKTVLEETADIVAIKAFEKGIEVICIFDPNVPTKVIGDGSRLRQILINIMGNAVKFTEEGEVLVRISLLEETTDQVKILFTVKDTGIGIPTDKIERLFEPFEQMNYSVKKHFEGTGLGLAISKELVQLMGGEIQIDSQMNVGSIFSFSGVLKKQTQQIEKHEKIPIDLHDKKILIVNQNDSIQLVLANILTTLNCTPTLVKTANMAIQMLKQSQKNGQPFQIAIIDNQLPDMDGLSLGEKIHQDPDIRKTMLILSIFLSHRHETSKLSQKGFCAYIVKPIKEQTVIKALVTASKAIDANLFSSESISNITEIRYDHNTNNNCCILLVEDSEMNRTLAQKILEGFGYCVEGVCNGQEAVHALEKKQYDIVLMDIQMPVMDGIHATKIIRDKNSNVLQHDIPIIAMTAHAMKSDRTRCINVGMNDYVSKPFNPEDVIALIEKYTSQNNETNINQNNTPETKIHHNLNKEIFDKEAFLQRIDQDISLYNRLIQIFIKEIPDLISKLRKAHKQNDLGKMEFYTHTIKGSAQNIKTQPLQTIALEIIQCIKNQNLNQVNSLISQLESAFNQVKAIL